MANKTIKRTSPRLGRTYTRRRIHNMVGGDLQSYLPHVGGRVVCGCFDPEMNPGAPEEVVFGAGENVVTYARMVAGQKDLIPVFIKRDTSKWEFVGNYRCVKLIDNPKEARRRAPKRDNPVGILFFQEHIDPRTC